MYQWQSMTSGKCDGINKEQSPNCDIRINEPKNKNKSENRKISLLNDNNMIGGGKKSENDFLYSNNSANLLGI